MLRKCKKLLSILGVTGVAIILAVVSLFVVSAEDITDAPPQEEVTDPPVIYTTAPPVYTTASEPVYTTAPPVYTQASEPEYTEPPVYTQAQEETYAPNNEYNNNSYNNYVEDYSFYQEPVTEYENQEEYYDTESTSPTDNTSSLYNSGREIDDTELSKSNWKKIAEKLAQTKENDDEDSSPFDYIKNSDKATGFQAFLNSLNWAMTAAIICFILAVVCIILFIVFTRKKKKGYAPKKKNKAKANPKSATKHSHASGITDEDGYYVPRSQRSKSDYGDDFGDAEQEKIAKKRAKQDTAEIIVPNKYRK